MKRLQMILLCFLFFAGCASIQIERRVDGNIFYSSRSPKLTMSVDNSLNYIGEQMSKTMVTGPDFADIVNISAYPFVKVKENNCIQQMFIIMVMKYEDATSYIRYKGGYKEVKIGGKKYKVFAGVGTKTQWFDALKINFLNESGYVFSERYGGMWLTRMLSESSFMTIVYLEEVSPSRNFTGYKEAVLKRGLRAFKIKKEIKETEPHELLDEDYVLLEEGQYNRAITYYNKAIEINPGNDMAYNNRCGAYYKKGQPDKAITDCTKAIEINPRNAMAYNNRGLAYYLKGQYDRAITEYNKAIEINPGNDMAYNNRCGAYYKKGHFFKAIADCTKAIEINPGSASPYINRGLAYAYGGQYDKAISDYTKAIEINPKYVKTYDFRGLAYSIKGKFDRACSDWKRACELGFCAAYDIAKSLDDCK